MPRRVFLPCADICARYAAGQSTTVIAQAYGCSPTTVAKHLRACGMRIRASRYKPREIAIATLQRAYSDEHWPIDEIAAYFGVAASTIGNARRRYGIPVRPRRKQP